MSQKFWSLRDRCIACVTADGSRSGGKKLIKISARSGKQFPRGHGEVECDDARVKFLKTKLLGGCCFKARVSCVGCVCVCVCNAFACNAPVCSFIKNFWRTKEIGRYW